MDEYLENMGDFFTEFEALYSDKDTLRSMFSLRAPQWQKSLKTGDVIRFDTTDLDGNPDLVNQLAPAGYPCTFFVDSEGRLLLDPVVGADVKGYPNHVDKALSLVEQGSSD